MALSLTEVSNTASRENNKSQLIIFSLSGCLFGAEIRQVREIIRLTEMTLVPKTPPFVEGIIHLRGKIIPIMDLKKRFGMPHLEYTPESRILIVDWREQTMGLLADRVLEVGRIVLETLVPVAEPILDINETFFGGRLQWREQMVLMLNLEKVFWLEGWKILPEYEMNPEEE